jgi:hypothetical protein
MANTISHFSYGNHKLPKSIAIFNITPATYCPSDQLGLCSISGKCYAKRTERLRYHSLVYRQWQTFFFDHCSVDEFVKSLSHKAQYLRISESGDFRSQGDVEKISQIADRLKDRGVKVYGYTARRDLDFSKLSDNLTMNGSGFMVHNQIITVKEPDPLAGYICPGSCKLCTLCTQTHHSQIQIKIH